MLGHTGSGKTQAGVWVLSCADIEYMPWIIIDYKGDPLINSIPFAQEIGFGSLPTRPGVHILHATPKRDDAAMEDYLWRIWGQGNTGVFVDEAYTMPDKDAYATLCIQGRAKHIPMINCSQRPSWIPKQVFTEADFHYSFYLNDKSDQKRVNEFAPIDYTRELPEYHSQVYRVKDRQRFVLKPVPSADTLLETFSRRLAPKRTWLR